MDNENKDKTESINETDLINHFNETIKEAISLNTSYLDPLDPLNPLYEPNTSITPAPTCAKLIIPAPLLKRSPDYLITDKEVQIIEERLEKRLDNLEKCVEKLNNENLALKTELSLLKLEVKKKLR